jgi:hypothetical protein
MLLKFEFEMFMYELFLSNEVFKRAPIPPFRFSTLIFAIVIP